MTTFTSDSIKDTDLDWFNEMLNNGHGFDLEEVQKFLCILTGIVNGTDATTFPTTPSDCFCEGRKHLGDDWNFQNAGEALRFIAEATHKALKEHK